MNQELLFHIFGMILLPMLVVVAIMPFIKKIAVQIDAVDIPGGRHIHKRIIPKLGGLAIFLGFLLGYMVFGTHSSLMNAILIGSFIIILTGVVDDISDLGPLPQFIGQLMAALVIVFYGQLLIKDVSAFGLYINFGIFSYPLTLFFILGCINCINFIDGLDGLSGGISAIYFLTVGIIGTIQLKTGLDITLAFVMLGSILGFLVYNFYPASVFAGDTGSTFMGFMISVVALLGFKNVTMTSFVIPLIILAIPILDTLFAILRRIIKRQPVTQGDACHLHHQLLNRNFSQRTAVLIIYAIDSLFAIASIVYVIGDNNLGYVLYTLLLIIVVLFVVKTNILFDHTQIKHKKSNRKKAS